MLPSWERGVALVILFGQLSDGQSIVSSIHYQRISVEAISWSDIRAHTLTGLE